MQRHAVNARLGLCIHQHVYLFAGNVEHAQLYMSVFFQLISNGAGVGKWIGKTV